MITTQHETETLADLAADRGFRLKDLGPQSTISLYNQGRALPGPLSLRRIAAALEMAPQEVMAICRAAKARRDAEVSQ